MQSSEIVNHHKKSLICPHCYSEETRSRSRLGTMNVFPFTSLLRKYQCKTCGKFFTTEETYIGFTPSHYTQDAEDFTRARAIGIELRRERNFTQTKLHEEYNPKSGSGTGSSSSYETISILGEHYAYTRIRAALRNQLMIGKKNINENAQALRVYMWQEKEPSLKETFLASESLLSIIEEAKEK